MIWILKAHFFKNELQTGEHETFKAFTNLDTWLVGDYNLRLVLHRQTTIIKLITLSGRFPLN